MQWLASDKWQAHRRAGCYVATARPDPASVKWALQAKETSRCARSEDRHHP